MTMWRYEEICCSICDWKSMHPVIMSIYTQGLPTDLDGRPSIKEGLPTIDFLVQRCPNCGYCAGYLGESHPDTKTVIETAEYKEQLNNRDYPSLANSFLCKAMVDNATGNLIGRTWSFIHAAWACDDDKKDDQAVLCRRRAAESLEATVRAGKKIVDQYEMNAVILVDMFRRSNQMENAKKLIKYMRNNTTDKKIRLIVDYELVLVQNKDVKRRTVEKALKRKIKLRSDQVKPLK